MTDQRRGRPTNYTTPQVLAAIALVQAAGRQPDGNNVKAAMQAQSGVSGGINAQSLGREVERLLQEQKAQRIRGLVAMLPPAVQDGVDALADRLKSGLLEQQAEIFGEMREEARRELVGKEQDLVRQRRLLDALETERDAQETRIAGLEQSCADLGAQREVEQEKIADLERTVAGLREQVHLRDEFRSALLDTIGQLGIKLPAADDGHVAHEA